MQKTIAAFAVLGALSIAPAALADETLAAPVAAPVAVPVAAPSTAEPTFVTPEARSVDKAELSARHTVADSAQQSQAAGGMDTGTATALGGLLAIVIAVALLGSL